MADAPFITGTDLLSVPGDAAAGYSSGVAYNGNPANLNPQEGIQSTLARLQQQDHENRLTLYKQRQDDLHSMANYFATTGQSTANFKDPRTNKDASIPFLPADQKELNDSANELMGAVHEDPNKFLYDSDIAAQKREHDRMVAQASLRAQTYAQYQNEMAKSNDPRERAEIQKSLDDLQASKVSDYKMPQPYVAPPTFTDKFTDKYKKDNNITISSGYQTNPDKSIVEVDHVGLPNSDFDPAALATDKEAATNYWNTGMAYVKNPNLFNAQTIINDNQKIDEYNKVRGLNIPHIADFDVNPQTGATLPTFHLNTKEPTLVGLQLAYAAHGGLQTTQKAKKTADETKQAEKEIESRNQDIKYKKQLIDDLKAKQTTAEQQHDYDEATALSALLSTTKVISGVLNDKKANWQPTTLPNTLGVDRKNNPISDKSFSEVVSPKVGLDLSNYQLSTIPTTAIVGLMGGVREEDDNGKIIDATRQPDKAFLLKDNKGGTPKIVLEYLYPKYSGSKVVGEDSKYRLLTPKEAAFNVADASNHYKAEKAHIPLRVNALYEDKKIDDLFSASKEGAQPETTQSKKVDISKLRSGEVILEDGSKRKGYYDDKSKTYYDANGKPL